MMNADVPDNIQTLADQFFALETREDIAGLLGLPEDQFINYLDFFSEQRQYICFKVPKKHGGYRKIQAPDPVLKAIQQKLNQVFLSVYKTKPSAHGFVPERNILSNALPHVHKKFVLNLDLEDFFPSITLRRVQGLFRSVPYDRTAEVANTLAQLCCYYDSLPQGAPTSPVISNMICRRMDSDAQRLAQKYRCTYTRYADDITFSTTRPTFPEKLAFFSEETQKLQIGEELQTLIENNGFTINERKSRLQPAYMRQEVTGLTVNEFPNVRRGYVREIRGMLHAWQKYGLDAAERTYREKYAGKHPANQRNQISFLRVVQGKLNFLKMIRGENDHVYLNLLGWFRQLAPDWTQTET